MKPVFKRILIYIAVIYLSFTLLIYFRQEAYIFFPTKENHTIEKTNNKIVEYELKLQNTKLYGWLTNQEYAKKKLVIYYGGNAEDIYYNIPDFQKLEGIATLLVNYRGYGLSNGKASEKNLFSDAIAIYDNIFSTYHPEKIITLGRSLGSGVATYLASQRKIDGVILVTPYDSVLNMAKEKFPFLPISIMLRHKFDSLKYVKKIKCPILVLYGGNDSVIPNRRTENLIKNIEGHKKIVLIKEADHNNINIYPEYWENLFKFINQTKQI